VSLQAVDRVGNVSPVFEVMFSLEVSLPPVIEAALVNDTGRADLPGSPSDGITQDPTIAGSISEAGNITAVRASIDRDFAGITDVTDRLNVDGSFTFDRAFFESLLGSPMEDGDYTLRMEAGNAFDQTSDLFELPFTLDSTPPVVTVTLILPDSDDPGNPGDAAAVYTLGAAAISGTVAGFEVSLDFSAEGGNELVFFGLDVSSSDPLLTASGNDFSAFSFTPALPLLQDWRRIPGADFGPAPFLSVVEFETASAPLTAGNYVLGTLTVDLGAAGVSVGAPVFVSIEAFDSVIGVELPGQPATFEFVEVGFDPGARGLGLAGETLTVRVESEAGSLARLLVDGQQTGAGVVSDAIEFTLNDLTAGTHRIMATAEDSAGNAGVSDELIVEVSAAPQGLATGLPPPHQRRRRKIGRQFG